jgi:hypothetical protein
MTQPQPTPSSTHDAEPDVTESPKDLLAEANAGRSDRTPAILWVGMHVVIGAFVIVVIAICLILYYVLK